MNNTKNKYIVPVISVLILLIALVGCILDAVEVVNVEGHPILTFLFLNFSCFGILAVVLAFIKRSPFLFMLGAISLSLSILYVFILAWKEFWWIGIICAFVLDSVIAIVCLTAFGSKTENIALNKDPEYKNYQERKAEKESGKEIPEEKPEIKSFK